MKNFSIWNFYARAYDVINENIPYLKMLDEVIREIQIKGNIKVLDAGCGTGNLLKKMSAISFNSKFVGLDSSKEMLNRAKKKFVSKPNITLQQTNLNENLKFPDKSFDCIVSVNSLYALQDPKKIISEFCRILKSKGKLTFVNPHEKSTFSGIMKRQFQELGLLKFILKFLINLFPLLIIIFVNIFFLKKNKNYWNQELTREILENAGFIDINIKLTYANQALLVSAIKK